MDNIPSHTGRKRNIPDQVLSQKRYTLPYREETLWLSYPQFFLAIHPPVQGGNILSPGLYFHVCDTPSRIGRKRLFQFTLANLPRYTLPYREETPAHRNQRNLRTIHPPIQGGNTQCLCGFQPPQTPRCAICTNGTLSLLICHFSGILADFYKKIFSHNNSKSLLIFPAISSKFSCVTFSHFSMSSSGIPVPTRLIQLSGASL